MHSCARVLCASIGHLTILLQSSWPDASWCDNSLQQRVFSVLYFTLLLNLSVTPTQIMTVSLLGVGGSGGGVSLELCLWRTDMVTSVIELDAADQVLAPLDEAMPLLYPPGELYMCTVRAEQCTRD